MLDISRIANLFLLQGLAFCACLLLLRVGVINIALEGQITLAAILYVIGAMKLGAIPGVMFACLGILLTNYVLVTLKLWWNCDELLVGIGLLFVSLGLADVSAALAFGTAGNAPLPLEARVGMRVSFVVGWLLVLGVAVASYLVRAFRVAKVLGDEGRLEELFAVSRKVHTYCAAILAAILTGALGMLLVETGGAYTSAIAARRGFVSLAIASVARSSFGVGLGITLIFVVVESVVIASAAEVSIGEIVPYLVALAVIMLRGAHDRRRKTNV
jgi:ABC-type uncharacterized transport system permease subunit